MARFTDSIIIRIKAGDGGAGAVSFHREKYIQKGGPDGGDGGKGGDVYFQADRRYYNLSHLYPDRLYRAGRGKQGMARNRHGSDGEDLIIMVPPGTQVINADTSEIITDLIQEGEPFCAARGGMGGKGNAFFKSSTHQTPRFSQPGIEVPEMSVKLDLKLIADIGLVGLPNAGKSTLLSVLTNARPKIGDYPFTTLIPNLGVIETEKSAMYTIADIPGIIEGAHKGSGLGLSFLQHIERVRVLLFLIDVTEKDPLYTLNLLRSELQTYNELLLKRPFYILLTKIDLVDKEIIENNIKTLGEDNPVIPVSAHTGEGMATLKTKIISLMEESSAQETFT